MSIEPRAYTTYFDQRYLAFALVTLRSIRKHDPQAEIFALCFDRVAFDVIVGLGDHKIIAVSTDSIHEYQPHLALLAKEGRARLPLYATHKPVMPLYTMICRPHLAAVAHVDADACFYSSPQPLYDEIGSASIALSPHRFAPAWKRSEEFGIYNAGFIYWRNDAEGRRCLEEYRTDCYDWCEPSPQPDGRFMNQGYLTFWPTRYSNVHIIMRLRDDMRGNNFADLASGGCACIDRTPNGCDITTDDGGNQAGVNFFPADESNIRRLNHGVGRFNHRHQASAFNHSKCFRHMLSPLRASI